MSLYLVSRLTPPEIDYRFAWKMPKNTTPCAQPKIASCRIFTRGLWICAYLEDFDRDYYYGHYFTSGETRTHGGERGIMHEKSLCAHSLSRSSVKCPQLCATFPNTNVCARAQACMLGCCLSGCNCMYSNIRIPAMRLATVACCTSVARGSAQLLSLDEHSQ